MKPKLISPIKDVYITQYFGNDFLHTVNGKEVYYYRTLGYQGHPGIDYRCNRTPILASHNGIVTYAQKDRSESNTVHIISKKEGLGYKTLYGHLYEIKVKSGQEVKAGDVVGISGNSGKYTTGPHLHFSLIWYRDGKILNYENGYRGRIDPAQYLPSGWDQPLAFHRYYRKGSLLAETLVRFKNPWLHRQLRKRNKLNLIYDNIFVNKITYGGWSLEESLDDSFHGITAYIKKSEYKNGIRPFDKTRF